MPFRNTGDVLCPCFPILPVPALVDDLPVNGILPFPELLRDKGKRKPFARNAILFIFAIAANTNDLHNAVAFARQVNLGKLIVQSVVMRPQRIEHLPHGAVFLVVVQSVFRGCPHCYADGQNDIAVLLARSFTHDPTNRLHHVHNRITRIQKDGTVQSRNVHAFRKALGIGQDAALVFFAGGIGLEPREFLVTLHYIHGSVNMFGEKPGQIDLAAKLIGDA